MNTNITPLEDGTFKLTFHKNGYQASTPMTVEELTLLHNNIISVLPDLAIPEEIRSAINEFIKTYEQLKSKTTTSDNSPAPRPVNPNQSTES